MAELLDASEFMEGDGFEFDAESKMGVELSTNLFDGVFFGDGILPPVPYRDWRIARAAA